MYVLCLLASNEELASMFWSGERQQVMLVLEREGGGGKREWTEMRLKD